MKKNILLVAAVLAFAFTSCISKDKTADDNATIDDGMNTSESTLGSGSTRPSDNPTSAYDATMEPAISDIAEENPGAVPRNAGGQTIHQGGIPGPADTTRANPGTKKPATDASMPRK